MLLDHAFKGDGTPIGWDSPSSSYCLLGSVKFSRHAKDTFNRSVLQSIVANFKGPGSIQKTCVQRLCSMLPSDFNKLINDRCDVLCPQQVFSPPRATGSLFNHLKSVSHSSAVMVLKTVVNSWTTSYRFHESVLLKCVFGCSCLHPLPLDFHPIDEVEHYLKCGRLWRIIDCIFPDAEIPNSVPARLGLVPGKAHLLSTVVAFKIYHFLKRGNWSLVASQASRKDVEYIHDIALRYGKFVVADLK